MYQNVCYTRALRRYQANNQANDDKNKMSGVLPFKFNDICIDHHKLLIAIEVRRHTLVIMELGYMAHYVSRVSYEVYSTPSWRL